MKQMNAEERRWRAESDADTMARYEEIMGDATRRNAAIRVAREKAADLQKRAGVMQRVAGNKGTTKKK